MTPMAAPCQIMIIESGDYTFKDYLKCGTPLALILAVITIFLMPMMFPFYQKLKITKVIISQN